MFCPFCGSVVDDGAKFCPSCGGDIATEVNEMKSAPSAVPSQAQTTIAPPSPTSDLTPAAMPEAMPTVTPASSPDPAVANLSSAQKRDIALAQAEQEGLGMKWYKFMIYFALFAGALTNIAGGALSLSLTSASSAQFANSSASSMLAVTGILNIAFGALIIYCRILLARFSKKAINMVYVVYGVNIALSVLTIMGSMGSGSTTSTSGGSLGSSIAFLIINVVYFKKRAHLFVND